jgi:predicted methyltransferase
MLDIAAYDAAERDAMVRCGDWPTIRAMRPDFFEAYGFPTRISRLAEISYLASTLGDPDATPLLKEIRGARPEDLDAVGDAVWRFIAVHRAVSSGTVARVPLARLLHAHVTHRKLKGLASRARILDIGPGEGYVSLFLPRDPGVKHYAAIEVTQSLYMMQSTIGALCFAGSFANHVSRPTDSGAIRLSSPGSRAAEFAVAPSASPRAALYPWWEAHRAFEQTYDVVMANENICEMPPEALDFYAARIVKSLAPEGVFLIQGIGKSETPDTVDTRFAILERHGFRSIVQETSFARGGPLQTPNLVLVGPRHPAHETAATRWRIRVFDQENALIRAMYGLDQPPGEITDHDALVGALKARLTGA